jgi:hypothetical protein
VPDLEQVVVDAPQRVAERFSLTIKVAILEDLRRRQAIDFCELRGRELVLYWRGLAPSAQHHVRIDAVAHVPGKTTGPVSRAYLYYTPQAVRWCAPLQVNVRAPRAPR